jgi:hypothetical protein
MGIQELRNEIKLEAAESSSFEIEAFARVFTQHLEEAERIFDANVEILNCRGPRGKRLELSGYVEDPTDDSVTLLASKYFGGDETLTLTEAREVMRRATGFLEHSLDGWLSQNLEDSARELEYAEYFAEKFAKGRISRVKVILMTDGFMSDRIRDIESEALGDLKVSFEIWDQRRVLEADLPELGSEDILVDFSRWLPKGLPCLIANSDETSTQTVLAVLPARILASIFEEYGSLLLESNVRTFLSARGRVNSGIQGTLAHEPSRFLSYNNGLTTTASGIELGKSEAGSVIKTISRWQIVNGGQTTASIAHYLRGGDKSRNVDDVYVQMKLVIVQPENSAEVVQAVAKYANSQNQVSAADLFSTHEFHVLMEQTSRRLRAPAVEGKQYRSGWYYERARGQWENDRANHKHPSDQKKFELEYPKSKRLTKTDWAKFQFAWDKRPHIVSKGAQSVFAEFAFAVDKAWGSDNLQFGDGYYRKGVAKAIIYEDLRSSVIQADWYRRSPGYLANIVAYSIARFSKYLEVEYPAKRIDFERIWKSQAISQPMKDALLEIAKTAQTYLTDPGRPQANVTQWAKQQACWEGFSALTIQVNANIRIDLLDAEEETAQKTEERQLRSIDSGLEAITLVVSLQTEAWDLIQEKLNESSPSPKERDMVKLFAFGKGVPSELQARVLIRLIRRMQDLGFIPNSTL